MSQLYAVSDWHIKYVAIKVFFGTKMIERPSVQEHGVKMLSLVEKLKDLKADLEKETYIDVILQSLFPSFDLFIVNYNMNGLDKDLHELINILVQYEATIKESASSVLIGDASTSEAKGKGARHWTRKKGYDSGRERVRRCGRTLKHEHIHKFSMKELDSFPYHRVKLSKIQSSWTEEELRKRLTGNVVAWNIFKRDTTRGAR
ncbi:hypothetical protein Sango_2426900 [Sesamum angolense]|uniref:Uncharacterized protein n=1 Tax=Sesamum angolense TaxID=2727404 RepID=A0AAE2BJZ7_9LAMI|nr:hypothetical protein Sango_2426900 [Sesamum angolense]